MGSDVSSYRARRIPSVGEPGFFPRHQDTAMLGSLKGRRETSAVAGKGVEVGMGMSSVNSSPSRILVLLGQWASCKPG